MGEEIRAHDEREAERRFQQGLMCCDITEAELPGLIKEGDCVAYPKKNKRSNRVDYDPT